MEVENLGGDMHELLSRELLGRLKADEKCEACGRGKMTIQELTLIRQFLADNSIVGGVMGSHKKTPPPVTTKLPFEDPQAPRSLKPE